MNLSRNLAGLLIASSVVFALPAEAHRGGPDGARMLRGLDLSQAQRDQASQIFQEHRPALRERAGAAREAHEALRKAALDPNTDSGRIRELADAAGRAHADAAVLRAETMRRLASLLTPEQRAKLEERRERQGHEHRR